MQGEEQTKGLSLGGVHCGVAWASGGDGVSEIGSMGRRQEKPREEIERKAQVKGFPWYL